MSFILQPWQLVLVILAGWVNRQQQQVIEFQRTQIDVLREMLGNKRLLPTEAPRPRIGPSIEFSRRKPSGNTLVQFR